MRLIVFYTLYYSKFIFYIILDDVKADPNIKNYLDHLGKCTAEELSMYL